MSEALQVRTGDDAAGSVERGVGDALEADAPLLPLPMGVAWQDADEAHGCRYCRFLQRDAAGRYFCAPLRAALEGFSFCAQAVLPHVHGVCEDYEPDMRAFRRGEGRLPHEAELSAGVYCPAVMPTVPLVQ